MHISIRRGVTNSLPAVRILTMSSADSSVTSSAAKSGRGPFIVTPPGRLYSSPPPDASKPIGKSCYSPPPPPCYLTKIIGLREPASVVEFKINSGRSILNPNPVEFSDPIISRKSPSEDFGLEDNCDRRSVRPRIDSGLTLANPSYPYLRSPSAPGDISDDEDDDKDMPSMPSPINLPMRCTRTRAPAPALRVSPQFLQHSFVPIQALEDEDE